MHASWLAEAQLLSNRADFHNNQQGISSKGVDILTCFFICQIWVLMVFIPVAQILELQKFIC
jgi:hypothetical protein